jgi:hypothetical protein
MSVARLLEIAQHLNEGCLFGDTTWIARALNRHPSRVRRWIADGSVPAKALAEMEQRLIDNREGRGLAGDSQLTTATGDTLDGHGLMIGLRRKSRETDSGYRRRIIAETIYRQRSIIRTKK